MNRMNILKYKDKGITIPAYITDKETYSQKISRKGRTRDVNSVQLRFTLNGNPGTAHVSEYIGEDEDGIVCKWSEGRFSIPTG